MSVERNYRDSNGRGVAGGIDRCLTPPIRLLDFRGVPVERLWQGADPTSSGSARLAQMKANVSLRLRATKDVAQDRLATPIAGLAEFI
jgi:hypothetical protein